MNGMDIKNLQKSDKKILEVVLVRFLEILVLITVSGGVKLYFWMCVWSLAGATDTVFQSHFLSFLLA